MKIRILVAMVLFVSSTVFADLKLNSAELKIEIREVLSFGTVEDDLLYFATSLTTDEKGFIFVTDSLDCSVKKFDAAGRLIAKAGRKGQGPGEFQFPVLVRYWSGHVCVVDQNLLGISVFDRDLHFQTRIPFETPIFDLRPTKDGRLLVLSPALNRFPPIVEVDLKGVARAKGPAADSEHDYWKRTGKFEVDLHGNVAFCRSFQDSVAKYDRDFGLIWEKGLLGNPKTGSSEIKVLDRSFKLPNDMVFKDITLDTKGLLFILGGHVSEHRSRDIYVVDDSGKKLTTIVLPEPTYTLHIDKDNSLYCPVGEGTGIKKYQLVYHGL